MSVAPLQLENVWQEMVRELREDTQLIGCSREQELNSLTWALNSLAGAPQTHPFLVELESANYSADRKEDHEPGFRGCELSTAACFFPPICSQFSPRAGGAHRVSARLPGWSAFLGAPLASSLRRLISQRPEVFPVGCAGDVLPSFP